MPLMFILFYAIIVPASSTNPVVIALETQHAPAGLMLQAIEEIESREGRYYEIVTTDPAQSRTMFHRAEALGMIVIPAGFEDQVYAGAAEVELQVRNINSDYTKNLALRLNYAVRAFSAQWGAPTIRVEEEARFAYDPTMSNYISTNLLLFACLYSSMLNTGLQVASDME